MTVTARANQSRDQVEQEIINKASADRAFHLRLLRDPRGTLEGELGSRLPPEVNVRVLEETPSQYYLVLPPLGVVAGSELSDAELGAVAGGTSDSWFDDTCAGTLEGPCWGG